ncbi:protoporphyrinogen oxidase [Paenibacillus sp. J45TS6]|uniref:protoporphyrinogen oxidase n=1 Tax=Paenibacillus sp. J45TS6 TaxID=2807196 RepID=UPI001B16BFF6|nr:protoporphyrinogen oxidase [Paenibacillus sp. J45TS6]GIP45597.1 protoporphyrinogen oxidase [Paenibacillus sp. J45TS6]
MKTIAVIGGGITGLSAAYALQKEIEKKDLDARVILFESNRQLGGKICTAHDDSFTMETGADSIVTRKKHIFDVIEELKLKEKVVYNETGTSFIHTDGELKQIPEDAMFGIPMSIESLAETTLVSPEGKVAALKDFYTPNETFTKQDSLGDFLEAFLGAEFVEKQIAPVISGVYSGNIHELTLASTMPYLLDYKNEYGSLIRGLDAHRSELKGPKEGKKFLSFEGGMAELIDAYERELTGVTICKNTAVTKIVHGPQEGTYTVSVSDGEDITVDQIILAAPHKAVQEMLQHEELNQDFERLRSSSMISIYLGYDVPDERLPANGTGFITSGSSDLTCNACTWTSRKWKHTSNKSQLLVRLFYKSVNPAYEQMKDMTQEELLQVAAEDVRKSLGMSEAPITHHVRVWHEEMPNYHRKHHELVTSLEEKMSLYYPGIRLAGCSYYGVGIPDCIANGEKTASKVIEQL